MKDDTATMIELYACLKELVELKQIKETDGETDDYKHRQPLAWANAKRVVAKHKQGSKYWGATA